MNKNKTKSDSDITPVTSGGVTVTISEIDISTIHAVGGYNSGKKHGLIMANNKGAYLFQIGFPFYFSN